MYTLFVVAVVVVVAVGGLSLFALLAFMAGEFRRKEQEGEVERYVRTRLRTLKLVRELDERKAEKKKADKDALEAASRFGTEMPVDEKFTENLAFLQKVALESPTLLATVIKRYVRNDPAVISGRKRATDPADFDAFEAERSAKAIG